jgi:hypothetical protein
MLTQNLLNMSYKAGNLFKHLFPLRKTAIVSCIVISEMNGNNGQFREIGITGALCSKTLQCIQQQTEIVRKPVTPAQYRNPGFQPIKSS